MGSEITKHVKICTLGSGSKGNSFIISNNYDEAILVDAGFSCKKMEENGVYYQSQINMQDVYLSSLPLEIAAKIDYKTLMKKSVLVRTLSGGRTGAYIIHKDKTVNTYGEVISETKTETKVEDPDKAVQVLTNAGFKVWAEIDTELHLFKGYRKEFVVHEVAGIGTLLEYEEDEKHTGLDLDDKINYMRAEIIELGLNVGKNFFVKKADEARKLRFQDEMQ